MRPQTSEDAERRWRRARWQEIIAAQANYVQYELDRLSNGCHRNGAAGQPSTAVVAGDVCAAVKKHLTNARHAACDTERPGRMVRLANVWTGALVCKAFANLHAAKVVLVDLYAEEDIQAAAPAVLVRLQTCLPASDQRRQRAEEIFGPQASPAHARSQGYPAGQGHVEPATRKLPAFWRRTGCSAGNFVTRRAALRDAMQVSYDAADEQYARLRSFRNVLITGTELLSLLVFAMCLLGANFPNAIPLCFSPSSTTAAAGQAVRKVCPTSELADAAALPGLDVTFVDQRAEDVLSSLPSKERTVTKEKQASTVTRPGGGEDARS